jgi:tRNA A-37 threonylcarbamoyl transferase component Bud32
MILKELKGHSGCKVYLCRDRKTKYVRKVSGSPSYNERLLIQIEKQKSFDNSYVRAPRVLRCGYNKGLVYFDMEYINGVPFNNYIHFNTIQNIDPIFTKLSSFIKSNLSTTSDLTSAIHQKLDSINTGSLSVSRHKQYCLDFDWSKIECGYCHGDLTFENMLVYKGDVYLIDFLDSFINTPFIDCAKVLQDIVLRWSWRRSDITPFVKNIHLYDNLVRSLSEDEREIVKRLLVLNVLRIVPYTKEKTDVNFIQNALEYLESRFIK